MKKVRFLALAMVVALGLMGAGYAYWTDTLTINNTVTTGEFNVQFSKITDSEITVDEDESSPAVFGLERNTPGYDQPEYQSGETWYASEYVNGLSATLSNENKQVDVTVGNLYPGSKGKIKTIVENTGTIPVVFDYAEVTYDDASAKLLDQLLFSMGKYEDEDPTDRHAKEQGITIATLEEKINDFLAGERLEPKSVPTYFVGEFEVVPSIMPLKLNVVLSPSATEDAEDLTGSFSVKLHWKQHNAQ